MVGHKFRLQSRPVRAGQFTLETRTKSKVTLETPSQTSRAADRSERVQAVRAFPACIYQKRISSSYHNILNLAFRVPQSVSGFASLCSHSINDVFELKSTPQSPSTPNNTNYEPPSTPRFISWHQYSAACLITVSLHSRPLLASALLQIVFEHCLSYCHCISRLMVRETPRLGEMACLLLCFDSPNHTESLLNHNIPHVLSQQ